MVEKAEKTNHLDKNLIRLRNSTFASNYVQYIVKLL
jgi:hypothetical protein